MRRPCLHGFPSGLDCSPFERYRPLGVSDRVFCPLPVRPSTWEALSCRSAAAVLYGSPETFVCWVSSCLSTRPCCGRLPKCTSRRDSVSFHVLPCNASFPALRNARDMAMRGLINLYSSRRMLSPISPPATFDGIIFKHLVICAHQRTDTVLLGS